MFDLFNSEVELRTKRILYSFFALLLALFFDFLFWDKFLGFNVLAFIIFYVIGFGFITWYTRQMRNPLAWFLVLPLLILGFDVVLYNNLLVQSLVLLVILFLLVCFSVLLTLNNPNRLRFSFLKIPVVRNAFLIFDKFSAVYKDLFHWGNEKQSVYKKILVGVLLALPLLVVFGALFASADAVFSNLVKNIFDFNIEMSIYFRILRILILMALGSGFFYVLISKKNILLDLPIKNFKSDKIIIAIVLGLINLLFLVFVFIQIKYLFGSAEFVLANNLTFAEYARKGFFELVWAMVIAMIIILVVFRSFSGQNHSKLISMLQLLFILLLGVIAVSALKRMNVYQEAYGYTVLRLYVEWFIYFCLFALFYTGAVVIINFDFQKFWYGSLILALVAFTIVASINVDRMIAQKNIERHMQQPNKEFDFNYLMSLSIDATPTLVNYLENDNTNPNQSNDLSAIRHQFNLRNRKSLWEFNFGYNKANESLEI